MYSKNQLTYPNLQVTGTYETDKIISKASSCQLYCKSSTSKAVLRDQPVVRHFANKSINSKEEKRVIVKGLAMESSVTQIKDYFKQFGEVKKVIIKYGNNRRGERASRGFAFVTFKSTKSVSNVVQLKDHYLFGRRIECKQAIPRSLTSVLSEDNIPGMDFPEAESDEKIINVKNIPQIVNYSRPYKMRLLGSCQSFDNAADIRIMIASKIKLTDLKEDSLCGPIIMKRKVARFNPMGLL